MGNLNEGCTVVSFEMLTATDRAVPGCRHCFFLFLLPRTTRLGDSVYMEVRGN